MRTGLLVVINSRSIYVSPQCGNGVTDREIDTAYAWVAGADPAYNPTGTNSLLYWQYWATCSHPYFDFVGANMPSIAFFKRGFGCDLVPYCAVVGYKSRWLKRAFALGPVLRG